MRIYQYDKHLDFHALGREIKRKREEKGWTQEYLAQLVDRTPRSIMSVSYTHLTSVSLSTASRLTLCIFSITCAFSFTENLLCSYSPVFPMVSRNGQHRESAGLWPDMYLWTLCPEVSKGFPQSAARCV